MIIRMVKMTFDPTLVDDFLTLFNGVKDNIRHFPGCQHLELLQHARYPNILYTYSYWEDELALATYRKSTLFEDTWKSTKQYFCAPPEAWSMVGLMKTDD